HTPLVHPHLYTLSLHDALPISLELYYTENISPLETITPGVGQGELIGGNLSVLTRTIGTQFEIETAGKLLLIEDIGEEPARVDGLLNQLQMAGKLNDLASVVVG